MDNNEIIIKSWFKLLAENDDIWNHDVLQSNIPIITHEYKRIKDLLDSGQYFGALLQIKDFFEVLLKLPVLILLNEKFNLQQNTEAEINFIVLTLEKPLSLGHWHELATFIKKYTLNGDSSFSSLSNNTIKLYNKNNIIKWRNEEIGHGALSLDDDQEFQDDIKTKLSILEKFLDANIESISSIKFDIDNATVSYGQNTFSINPFFNLVENKIYFFDSYLSRKQKVHQLNYCFGKKIVSETPDFENFISQYEIDKRDKKLSSCSIEDVRLAEEEKQLDLLEESTEFIKPVHLMNWLKNSIEVFPKGKFLLQMQRGTGKSLFCKAIDQLALNKIELNDDILVRAFYINDVFRNSLSDFTSELSYFILNKKLESKNFIDVFKGNLPNLNIDSTKSDFAYLLNWYKQKYDVEQLLLIIDGVDEIPQIEDKTIFDILPDQYELDDGIYLLITSRTDNEITGFTREQLNKLNFENVKVIEKKSPENEDVLKTYIKKFKLTTDEKQTDSLIDKADFRLLYLNMLKEIILSCDITIDDIPESEKIIEFYIQEVKKKYGEKYFQSIFDILLILASQLEEMTINEIAYLNNDASVNLKLLANMFDLRGFVKKTRSIKGNLFSLNHISLTKYFNISYKKELKNLIMNLYSNVHNMYNKDEADIYKMAYLEQYEKIYEIDLSSNLNSDIVLSFILGIKNINNERVKNISLLLVNLLLKEGNIYKMVDYLAQLEEKVLHSTIEAKMQDKDFIQFIIDNIDNLLEQFDSSKYDLFKTIYINFYKYDNREIAFKVINFLMTKNESFEDILNYISMCKGDSKWEKATAIINQYLHKNTFEKLQLAQFYYIIGRMYVDDLENFHKSKGYLEQSIDIYEQNKQHINANVVANTLSMYYFSNGDFEIAFNLLYPIYKEVMDDNGIIYDQNAIESIYNNMCVYSMIVEKSITSEQITFLNKEVELYYKNTLAIAAVNNGEIDKAKNIMIEAIEISTILNKNYAEAALLYNYGIYFNDNNKLTEAKRIIKSKGYTMGEYIINNKKSSRHVLNTFKIENKHFWLCVKNVDLLV